MSTEAKAREEFGVLSQTELVVGLFKVVSSVVSSFSHDDQKDLMELLVEMSRSNTREERAAAEETLREILKPKSGKLISMIVPGKQTRAAENWSAYTGKLVRQFRKESNLTQEELARKADLPQSHISRIENQELSPNRHTLEKIAAALQRPLADFDPSA